MCVCVCVCVCVCLFETPESSCYNDEGMRRKNQSQLAFSTLGREERDCYPLKTHQFLLLTHTHTHTHTHNVMGCYIVGGKFTPEKVVFFSAQVKEASLQATKHEAATVC